MSTHQSLHLETIPNEFLGIIVSFLDPPSAHCFGLTNHFFYDTVTAVCQRPFNEICPRHHGHFPATLQDTVLTEAEQKFHTAVLAVDSNNFYDSGPCDYQDRWGGNIGALSVEGFKLAWQLRYSDRLPQEQGRCLMLGHHEMNSFNNRRFRDGCVLCYQICNWIHQLRKGRTQGWGGYEYPAEHLEALNLMYGGQLAREGRSRSESPSNCDDNGPGFGGEGEIYTAYDKVASDESGSDRLESDDSGSSESESEQSRSDNTRSEGSESGTSGAEEEEDEEEEGI